MERELTARRAEHGSCGRITIIANPMAGSTSAEFVSMVADAIGRHVRHVNVLWTGGRGQASEFAQRCALARDLDDACDVIVVIGGDGTLREVAAGLVGAIGTPVPPLLVLPGGTGNSNYRSLWDDVPWDEAVIAGLTGVGAERRVLDLATILRPPRLVVLGTSAGLFAEATAAATTIPRAGRSRYLTAIASAARSYVPYPGQVIVDGALVHEGPTVLVSIGGSRHRAGVLEVLPCSLRDDGLLDVCVIGAPVSAAQVAELVRGGTHLGHEGVVYARGECITVRRLDGQPLAFESDGEVVDSPQCDFTVEVLPQALPVLSSSLRPGG